MSAQLPLVFPVSMATAASQTEGIDLGGVYNRVELVIPAQVGLGGVSGTPYWVKGSPDGSNYYRWSQPQPNTSTTTILDFVIASNTTSRIIPLPGWSSQYLKVEISGVVSAATFVFKVICS